MVKFKFLKRSVRNIRCLLRRMFKPECDAPPAVQQKNEKKGCRGLKHSPVPSASSAEGFIPLAARDSQWVGIDFYNPNFRSPLDEEYDAEEVELQNLAADGADAIILLFPGLKKKESVLLKERESSSTTEITKLLVGQKADFRNMKSSKKLLPTDTKLDSVQEMPQEEKNASETDVATTTTRKKSITAAAKSDPYDVDDEDEDTDANKRTTHTKKRKKRSDLGLVPAQESSVSVLVQRQKPPSKLRQSTSRLQQSKSNVVATADTDSRLVCSTSPPVEPSTEDDKSVKN